MTLLDPFGSLGAPVGSLGVLSCPLGVPVGSLGDIVILGDTAESLLGPLVTLLNPIGSLSVPIGSLGDITGSL